MDARIRRVKSQSPDGVSECEHHFVRCVEQLIYSTSAAASSTSSSACLSIFCLSKHALTSPASDALPGNQVVEQETREVKVARSGDQLPGSACQSGTQVADFVDRTNQLNDDDCLVSDAHPDPEWSHGQDRILGSFPCITLTLIHTRTGVPMGLHF